jgi:hypothetical protein
MQDVSVFHRCRRALCLSLSLIGAVACDPYEDFHKDDYALGPVDPVAFPAANLGTGGDRKRPGRGSFREATAFVGGQPVGYIGFALPPAPANNPRFDQLRLREEGRPYIPVPTTYVFDSVQPQPFPQQYPCNSPNGYQFNAQRDEVPLNEQGNVFTALPTATYAEGVASTTSYRPIVAEARVSSAGQPCQKIKSEKLIEKAFGGRPMPGGAFLAWAIIDPGAAVYPREDPTGMMHPGVGLQWWGWYNRYLLAYLDGGYIPTVDVQVNDGTMAMPVMKQVTRMRPQRLFVPRVILNAMGMMAPGARGAGYDVLEARRGEEAYSPVCELHVYGDPMMPVPVAMLPKDAAAIAMLNPAPAAPATVFFCLQVR